MSSTLQTKCEQLFQTFNKAKLFKAQIDTFFRTFAPSQTYWAGDIKELDKVYRKLENWHDLSLNAIINENWRLVGTNAELLQTFDKISSSKICVSIWKALIEEQENKWNLKQLRNMSTYDMANWIRTMSNQFSKISHDFNIEIFVQIEGGRWILNR